MLIYKYYCKNCLNDFYLSSQPNRKRGVWVIALCLHCAPKYTETIIKQFLYNEGLKFLDINDVYIDPICIKH